MKKDWKDALRFILGISVLIIAVVSTIWITEAKPRLECSEWKTVVFDCRCDDNFWKTEHYWSDEAYDVTSVMDISDNPCHDTFEDAVCSYDSWGRCNLKNITRDLTFKCNPIKECTKRVLTIGG